MCFVWVGEGGSFRVRVYRVLQDHSFVKTFAEFHKFVTGSRRVL